MRGSSLREGLDETLTGKPFKGVGRDLALSYLPNADPARC